MTEAAQTANILLVEDSVTQALNYRQMLASSWAEFAVVTAESLASAFEHLDKEHIDLVLLDLTLPDAMGMDTFLSMYAKVPDLPIIVLTGLNDHKVGLQAVKSGAQDYLIKSQVNQDLLLRSVRYSLERKRADRLMQDRKVEEARLELAAIVESSHDAILAMDLKGTVRSWNNAATQIFLYAKEEIAGKSAAVLLPQDRAVELSIMLDAISKARRVDVSSGMLTRKDNTTFDASITMSPIRDMQGTIVGASAIIRDITDQVLARQQREDIVSTLANDVKTSVISQQQAIGVLTTELVDPARLRELLEMMQTTNRDVLSKLSKMIVVYQYSVEDQTELAAVQVKGVVQEVVDEFQQQANLLAISFSLQIPDTLSPIVASRHAIKLMMSCLISNAVRFNRRGGTVMIQAENATADVVRIRVVDSGCGMPQEQQSKLFQRFWQSNAGANARGGTGFGLYLCSLIARTHRGTIECSSDVGAGTTITVALPALSSTPASPKEAAASQM